MKLACLLLLLLPVTVKADSITAPLMDAQLSGVVSVQTGSGMWFADNAHGMRYGLLIEYGTTGNLTLNAGNTHIYTEELNGSMNGAGTQFSGTFSGIEWENLGKGKYVYWDVTGTITETVNFSSPTGVGNIQITSASFAGTYPHVTPEPGTWLLMLTGLAPIISKVRRYVRS